MPWQFLGPHAKVVLELKRYAICREHIRLSFLGTTCDCIAWTHMRGQLWRPYTKIRVISFLGETADIIAGEHKDVSSRDYMRFRFWAPRRILVWIWSHLHLVLGFWTVTRLFKELKKIQVLCSTVCSESVRTADTINCKYCYSVLNNWVRFSKGGKMST
jgi:hypothetical protein